MKTNRYLFKITAAAIFFTTVGFTLVACEKDTRTDGFSGVDVPELLELSEAQKAVIATLPSNVIIAHRGTEFWAPEESEVAMRWARNMGADYLEIDLQRSKDKVLLALHDDNLTRTTDVALVFPNRKNDFTSAFLFEELLRLDIGSWFNYANPKQGRETFVGEQVLTLEDIIRVAEGYRYLRKKDLPTKYPGISEMDKRKRVNSSELNIPADLIADGHTNYVLGVDETAHTVYIPDEADNGHRPGVYIETKAPFMFGGIEGDLAKLITKLGWYADNPADMKHIPQPAPPAGKRLVNIANTDARIILQTFDKGSLINLSKSFKRLRPILFLYGDMGSSPATYADKINFAIANNATIMGPNIDYVPGYASSIMPWQGEMIRRTGMHIHAWSFNTQEQYIKYTGPWSDPAKKGGADKNYLDGSFTNLTDLALNYYNDYLQPLADSNRDYFRSNKHLNLPDNLHKDKPRYTAKEVLDALGY